MEQTKEEALKYIHSKCESCLEGDVDISMKIFTLASGSDENDEFETLQILLRDNLMKTYGFNESEIQRTDNFGRKDGYVRFRK